MAPVFEYVDQTGGAVWSTWSNTTAATTNATYIWNGWNAEQTTSVIFTSTVWAGWVAGSGSGVVTYVQAPPLTPEQVAAREAAAAAHQVEIEASRELERVKRERAKKLLEGALERKQRKELREHGYFHVETRDGTRRYRLSPTSQPRRVHGEDGRQWSYCIHPDYGYPPEDVVLAQKLLLEADEDAFLRIANASAVRVAA